MLRVCIGNDAIVCIMPTAREIVGMLIASARSAVVFATNGLYGCISKIGAMLMESFAAASIVGLGGDSN